MITYKEAEKSVFDFLILRRQEIGSKWNFSVRRKKTQDAESDFFIGTEKSGYFGFTFWWAPVAFPGSSSDLINYIIQKTKQNKWIVKLQFSQTKHPSEGKNKKNNLIGLEVAEYLAKSFSEEHEGFYTSKNSPNNKMFYFSIESSKQMELANEVTAELGYLIEHTKPIVDNAIELFQKKYPEWEGGILSDKIFYDGIDKLSIRQKKINSGTQSGVQGPLFIDDKLIYQEKNSPKHSLNSILYGPPGSGKTYSTIDRAVTIADGQSAGNHAANKKRFDQLRTDGRIEFITFHQNYSYEDFMTGLRPEPAAQTLKFERVSGVFMDISTRSRENWERSNVSSPNALVEVEPSFDDVFYSFFQKLIEEEVPGVEIKMRTKSFSITKINFEDEHIKFTKNSGGTGHDLVISIVKGIYDGSRTYRQDGLGIYYFPLVEALKEHSRQIKKPVPTEDLLNYVLIIDEINRANISRVFGELITLLEDDKRLGNENELRVTLPGGIRDFGVPANLYIIGTMNTADKSIALVDIALRRRFEFIGMYPTSEVLDELVEKERISPSGRVLLQVLNNGIYKEKKTADFLIGHAYLIGKTQDDQIEDVIRKKIIPLLMEYFSGRPQEVSKLFDGSGWKVNYDVARFEWKIEKS